MYNLEHFLSDLGPLGWIIIIMVIWDTIWKVIGMWKSARNNHLIWFICIAIFNTFGFLPIIYIILDKKKQLLKDN